MSATLQVRRGVIKTMLPRRVSSLTGEVLLSILLTCLFADQSVRILQVESIARTMRARSLTQDVVAREEWAVDRSG
jgi:hypothetical protein